jgi:hypothetical protein
MSKAEDWPSPAFGFHGCPVEIPVEKVTRFELLQQARGKCVLTGDSAYLSVIACK